MPRGPFPERAAQNRLNRNAGPAATAARRPDVIMQDNQQESLRASSRSQKPPPNVRADDELTFRRHTQRVWSSVAGRAVSGEEADEIIQNFGRFLRALAGKAGKLP